jgi:Fis family transcriptional regulator, factor for inversion stimulation protein
MVVAGGVVKVQLENLVRHMYKSGLRYSEAVREFQTAFILTVLQESNGNQVRAARKLGIHRNSLRRIIRDLQLDIRAICAAASRRPPQSERVISLKTERAT